MFGVAESRSFQYSAGLHVGVVLLFVLGLPSVIKRAEPQPTVMTVEILPISAMTNVKPSDKPIQKAQSAKAPVNAKPIPQTAQAKPQPEPEPVKKDELTIPDPTVKPKPQEKEKPKEPEKKSEDFAALMSKLNQEAKKEPAKEKPTDTKTTEENKTRSDAPYDDSMPLSMSEKDMIRSQFIKCWIMPAGSPNPESLIVKIMVSLGMDGTVNDAKLHRSLQGRYNSDTFFRAAADSAIRAVWKCSPLQNMPADKYGSWREMELTFDPQELLF